MSTIIRIGIIGDHDGRPSHLATEEAIRHCANTIGVSVETEWLPTETLVDEKPVHMYTFNGFWCAPGSPYKSMLGAMNGIRFARVRNIPFLGTCGGFQHSVLEFGRNVLQIKELQNNEFDPYVPNHYITPLTCSLVGQTRQINIDTDSVVYKIYQMTKIEERYNCSFGLDKGFQELLNCNGFKVAGVDENGEARIMVLQSNKFFVATLFQPQLSSKAKQPHQLILAYLNSML